MTAVAAKFKLDEKISFSGKPMRVAGFVQYEGANAQVSTRYLLVAAARAPVILEESGSQFALLRPFPPTAQPLASGGTVTVMGANTHSPACVSSRYWVPPATPPAAHRKRHWC